MRPLIAIPILCCFPMLVWADVAVPGHKRVLHDAIIEIDKIYPDYRFFFWCYRDLEPLPLAPGQPYRIDGQGRRWTGSFGNIFAIPRLLVEERGESALAAQLASGKEVPGLLRSDEVYLGEVSLLFLDPRERVIDRYRLEISSDKNLRLILLGDNSGRSRWVMGTWMVVGLSASVIIIWGVWRMVSRIRRPRAAGEKKVSGADIPN